MSRFRRAFDGPRLTREEAERQGRIARLAFEKMPQAGAAAAFLNTHDETLGGRPIDLAVAGGDGLAMVEAHIAALPEPPPGSRPAPARDESDHG